MNVKLALQYLTEMSTDVCQALIVDRQGAVLATTFEGQSQQDAAADLVGKLLRWVSEQEGMEGEQPYQLELAAASGSAFLTLGAGCAVVAVTGRSALPALVLYDMHTVVNELESEEPLKREN